MKKWDVLNKKVCVSLLLVLFALNISAKWNWYKVTQIDSLANNGTPLANGVYVIYCKDCKGQKYKILTHYDRVKTSKKYEMLKVGKWYRLSLESIFRSDLKKIGAEYTLSIIGREYCGNNICIEIENNIYDLFEAKQINGIFVKRR